MADHAVLAIDSRITLTAGDSHRRGEDTCKLRPAGRFLVAIAGLHDHAATQFDTWALAEEAASSAPSVSEAIARVEQRVGPPLRTALWNIQAADLAGFARHFARAHVAVVVAGVDEGGPAIAAVNFVPDANAGVRVVRWSGPAGAASIFLFGEHQAIDRTYPDKQALFAEVQSQGAAGLARKLIEREIADEPEIVGPPISIVEITRAGVNWLDRGLCR